MEQSSTAKFPGWQVENDGEYLVTFFRREKKQVSRTPNNLGITGTVIPTVMTIDHICILSTGLELACN